MCLTQFSSYCHIAHTAGGIYQAPLIELSPMAKARELVSAVTLGKVSRDSYMGLKIFQLLTTISITCSRILEKMASFLK